MFKYIILAILVINFIYDVVCALLSRARKDKPLPENVRDVYDEAQYKRWREYSAEGSKLSMIEGIFSFIVMVVLFATNILSLTYNAMPGSEFVKSILLMVVYSLVLTILSIPFGYIRTFKIEEKYGFNKSTVKTFVSDEIKNFIIGTVVNCILLVAAYLLCRNMTWIRYLIFVAIGCVFVIAINMLATFMQRMFNKFTSLPEGELRDALTEMFSSEGYQLEDIYVMDASRRTTKVNAYCGGIGKTKRIVLYDNLVNNYTPGEIAAVFAHELAHFKNRDTAKLTAFSIFNVTVMISLISLFALVPEISMEYGFDGANMAFALIALMSAVMSPIMTLIGLPINGMSRHFERRADTFAATKGYGCDMISALKKLSKDNLVDLNPHPFIVAMSHNHPTLSQRITLVEEKLQGTK